MVKKHISDKLIFFMIIIFINGVLVVPNGEDGGRDIWFVNLIGMIIGIVIFGICLWIWSKYPKKNMYQIIFEVFGKKLGMAINIGYIIFTWILATMLFRNFSLFIKTVGISGVSTISIVMFPLVLLMWILKKDMVYFARFTRVIAIPFIILVFISLFILSPQVDVINVLPIFRTEGIKIFKGIVSSFVFPFGELILFFFIFDSSSENGWRKKGKMYLGAILTGGVILIVFNTFQILVLGVERFNRYQYPAYAMFTRIQIGDFFSRIEIILGLLFLFGDMVKITVCMFVLLKGFKEIFRYEDDRIMTVPIVMGILNSSFLFKDNLVGIRTWHEETWRGFALIFQFFIPLIIGVTLIIKDKIKDTKNIKSG